MAMPLLVFYEVVIVLANTGRVLQMRVGADVWMKNLLAMLGGVGMHVLAAVVLVGAAIFYVDRRRRIPIRARYMGWVIGESAVYAVVLALFVSATVGWLFAAIAPVAAATILDQGLWTRLALSVGAGLYEELFFRVLLVGGMFLLFRRLMPRHDHAYVLAALIGALIFSAVHYTGPFGDVFTLPSFVFRFLFGLLLNVVFLVRGFGVAAWTHALYDVMVVTRLLG
jgi:membrane protease YdiL (CAAX protease family)